MPPLSHPPTTLADDIYLQPTDVAAFQPWLPLNGGNRTLVLAGARPGASQTVLDFGGAVSLLYHPAGHSFICHGLLLQGMTPASSGVAAGLQAEMVGAYIWSLGGRLGWGRLVKLHRQVPATGLQCGQLIVKHTFPVDWRGAPARHLPGNLLTWVPADLPRPAAPR